MANPLTGDFEAVLQVSGNTINRLLAGLHQNGFSNPKLPSFPHSVQIRIGGDHAIDGVRGLVRAQVAVPRVELIHGVTDRFRLEVGLRAWFVPDYDSKPFPAFVHGIVHAEYRLEDIDPHCAGWSRDGADYFWVRVVKESVRFEGTADDDSSPLDSQVVVAVTNTAVADAANAAKVTRQVAGLLATRFTATPHPVGKRFRRGAMRSLNVPVSGTAVATAIGLSGEPAGNIASVNTVLLDGADLALALNVNFLMSVVSQSLDPIRAFNRSVPIHIKTPVYLPDINTVYHVTVDPPIATWEPHGGHALIKVKVHGRAQTNSVLANATFDVTQDIVLGFDAGSGTFTLSPGAANVTVHAGGLYSGTVASTVKAGILAELPIVVQAACNQARPQLEALTARTQDLTQQLQTLDPAASTNLDAAVFTVDGIVLRGTIGLGRRAVPVVQFEKLVDGSAFSALQSWIPGGRIDRFRWSWSWSASATGAPGFTLRDDRFLLRRPFARPSRWGISLSAQPLPGLDGIGSICLRVSGVRTDPVTGNLVAVQSTQRCKLFSLGFVLPDGKPGRLFLRDTSGATARTSFAEMPLVAIGARTPAASTANTLVVRVGERWDRETIATLREGVHACRRYDAGLSLLVLFREGALEGGGLHAVAEIEEMARGLGIGAHVNEDVQGAWTRTLALGDEQVTGWAMLSPQGTPVWTHLGPLSADKLANVLDTHLRTAADASPSPLGLHHEVGEVVNGHMLDPDYFDEIEQHCPPPPYGTRGLGDATVAFVQKGSAASLAELRGLLTAGTSAEGERPVVIAVIDGADAREATALQSELGHEVVAIADASGTVTDRFGIAVWPTTVTLKRDGTISAIAPGGTVRAEAERSQPLREMSTDRNYPRD
jgi:hypothetical protein